MKPTRKQMEKMADRLEEIACQDIWTDAEECEKSVTSAQNALDRASQYLREMAEIELETEPDENQFYGGGDVFTDKMIDVHEGLADRWDFTHEDYPTCKCELAQDIRDQIKIYFRKRAR